MKVFQMSPVLTLVFTLVLVSVACSQEELTAEQYFKQAESQFAGNNINAAIIQLKNALQKRPDYVEARFLLGKLYLEANDGVSAEKEFNRAKSLGLNDMQLDLLLAKSLKLQSKNNAIVDRYLSVVDKVDGGNTLLATIVSDALLGLGRVDQAEMLVGKLEAVGKNISEVELTTAKLFLLKGDKLKAEKLLKGLTKRNPEFDEAWIIKGNIEFQNGEFENAKASFTKIVNRAKNEFISLPLFSAYIGKLRSELALKEVDAAMATTNVLVLKVPKHPLPKYFKALVLFEQKQMDKSREQLQLVLKDLPDHLPSHLLLGTILYQEGSYEQADNYLSRFVNNIPTHVQARKMLAATRLKQHRPGEAFDVLEPIVDEKINDAQLLAMIGQAAIKSGDMDRASQYLTQASTTKGFESSVIRSELAKIYMSQGEYDLALHEIEELAKTHPKQSEILKIVTFVQRKQLSEALSLVENLVKQYENDAGVLLLKGRIQLASGNKSAARKTFYHIIDLQKDFVQAYLSLAQLELSEDDILKATVHYDNVLLFDAKNESAMIGQAQISERKGDIEQAVEWLQRSRRESRNGVTTRLLLARYFVRQKKLGEAVGVAEEAVKISNNDPKALQALAFVQMQNRQFNQAVDTMQVMTKQRPKDTQAWVKLARVQAAAKDYASARANLATALNLDSNNLAAKHTLANIALQESRFDESMEIGKELEKQWPDLAVGYLIQGDTFMAEKKYDKAALRYQQANRKQPTLPVTLKHSKALALSGEKKAAILPLEKWIETHADDAQSKVVLAAAYQSAGLLDKAIEKMEALKNAQPNNAVVLNNLSWMYFEKNDPRSIELAEKAHELEPNTGAITDTLGWILVQNGELKKGVDLLRVAVDQTRKNPEVRYHLAVGLVKQGDKREAKEILVELVKKGIHFGSFVDAKKLLEEIAN